MDINTCYGTTASYHAIAYYSHLIPVFITLILSAFVLVKSQFSLIAKVFTFFAGTFCLWLIGDVILWTGSNYNLINFLWAPLDYINIVFYLFGAYFFYILVKGRDMPLRGKLFLFLLSLPAWWVTISNQSITSFNQPFCEAFNSPLLTNYKLAIEIASLAFILVLAIKELIGYSTKKKQIVLVALALVLFLSTFLVTEYISSITGIYEINLYSLFVLPIFLFLIIYSTTNLHMFQLRLISTQLLAYVMIVLVGSQLFFLESTTNQVLTTITFVLTLSFGVVLSRDAKRELEQREYLERISKELASANDQLRKLDQQKNEFLSFASHDLKSPIALIKQFATLIYDGTYKEPTKVHETVGKIKLTADRAVNMVNTFLDLRKIEEGHMEYNFEEKNIVEFVSSIAADFTLLAKQQKNIDASFSSLKPEVAVKLDTNTLRQVIQNYLDNSLKYTESGWIKVEIIEEQKTVLIKFSDSGLGMDKELLPIIYGQFHRDPGVAKKIQGTGLGLFIAKQIIQAHHGDTWAESEGKGKGSQFYIRLPKA